MAVAYLSVIAVSLGVWIWLEAVLFGASLLRFLTPSTFTNYGVFAARFHWLYANLLLLLIFASNLYAFPKLKHSLTATGDWAMVCLCTAAIVHAGLMTFVLLRGKKGPSLPVRILLSATALVSLETLLTIGMNWLTGGWFWQSGGELLLFLCVTLGVLALAGAYMFFIVGLTPHGKTQFASRLLSVCFVIITAVLGQAEINTHHQHLLSTALTIFMVLVGSVILAQLASYVLGQERYMWFYLSLVTVTAPLLLALANRPFLRFPSLTLTQSLRPHVSSYIVYGFTLLFIVLFMFSIRGYVVIPITDTERIRKLLKRATQR